MFHLSSLWRPAAIVLAALLALGIAAGPRALAASAAAHRPASARPKLIHAGYLTVGSDTTYPPMESSNIQHPGQYGGADIDLAGALAHAMGLKGARIVSTSFNSIIAALQRKNFDVIMSSMNDTPERRKQITFVDYMHLKSGEAILVNANSSIHASNYSGLCGDTVSVESGTVELDGLNAANKSCKKKMTIKSYTADTDAFQAFAAHHSDAYTTDFPVALYYLKQHSGAIRLAGKTFGTGGYYGIGVLKSNPGLKHALQTALTKIRKSGQYQKILAHWGLSSTAL